MIPLYYFENEIKDKKAFCDVMNDIRQEAFFEPEAYVLGTKSDAGRALALAFTDNSLALFLHKGYAVIFAENAHDDADNIDTELRARADAVLLDIEGAEAMWLRHVYERHYDIPWHILDTERTTVREASSDDIDALYELYAAPGMTDYLEPLYEREKEEQYQKDYRKNIYSFYGYGMWLVFDKNSGRLIGRCGIDPHEDGVELGYMMHPDCQRQGIAYEVCSAIIKYAKEELGISKLCLKADAENIPSVALALKLGFSHVCDDLYEIYL